MRKIYYVFIAGTLLFGISSCNDKNEKGNEIEVEEGNVSVASDKNVNTHQEVALNPPHGEPGHRCEIPVGQPLPNGSDMEASTNGNSTSNKNNEVKLNPPHGEPGHRCEIPVGQPLSGSTNTTNSSSSQNVQLTTPLMQKNKGEEKLNPPHGEPGHRCEIPVGQPLP